MQDQDLQQAQSSRPYTVVWAFYLAVGSLVLWIGVVTLNLLSGRFPQDSYMGSEADILILLGFPLALSLLRLIQAATSYGFWLGRNASRWVFIVLAIAFLVFDLLHVAELIQELSVQLVGTVIYVSEQLMVLAAAALLVLPESDRWYRDQGVGDELSAPVQPTTRRHTAQQDSGERSTRLSRNTLIVSFGLGLVLAWAIGFLYLGVSSDYAPGFEYLILFGPTQALVLVVAGELGAVQGERAGNKWKGAHLGVWLGTVVIVLMGVVVPRMIWG